MKVTLRQIEVFAAIARAENVSRAAVLLNMSQSAASTALLELERHFDCPLFDRVGKSLRLNGSGRGLLPQAEDMLARSSEIEGFLAGGKLAPVAVGATLTIGNYLATLVVVEYLRNNPGSRVDLSVCNTQQVIERLRRTSWLKPALSTVRLCEIRKRQRPTRICSDRSSARSTRSWSFRTR